jgi:hypothetical protein
MFPYKIVKLSQAYLDYLNEPSIYIPEEYTKNPPFPPSSLAPQDEEIHRALKKFQNVNLKLNFKSP